MTDRFYLNDDWKFSFEYSDNLISSQFDAKELKTVRIPHTVKETPFNYFDESIYQTVSGYVRDLYVPSEWEGKSVRLTFEGVAHKATVYINGREIITHECGYTAFTADISDSVIYGGDNRIVVKADSNESLNQPPFGYVIDYMTYGGIYRDVFIEVSEKTYIKDVFLKSFCEGNKATLVSDVCVEGNIDDVMVRTVVEGAGACDMTCLENRVSLSLQIDNIKRWDINDPVLYNVSVELYKNDEIIDRRECKHGFRTSEFKKDGYYLNGRKVKLRGLNRHQSYPYAGYAMPDSMQKLDADILKYELGLNAVRTSHYPQSHAFISRCDEIGLLVFTEIPGWQHIGDAEWKDKAVNNVRDMVLQYRNHPSIILWGVRINESVDDDEFYKRTNETAHELDPTRPTGGVRCFKNSNLYEDVYTYNDFSYDGTVNGCEAKKKVTSDVNKSYLISEYNGHMFPTKVFDTEEHRREHSIRHATVLNAVAGESDIAGSFGWCMFDYNTHKDFGSGDRICYHGVMDMFRNPKMAASVYACEGSCENILEISSTMDIGEHPGSNRGKTWIFSNADSVRMYKNDKLIKEYKSTDSTFANLSHGPLLVDDFIGNAIVENEKFSKGQAETVKQILNLTALSSTTRIPKKVMLLAAKAVLVYHMKPQDAVALFSKYIGDWGGTSTVYKFEAVKDGKVVKTVIKSPTKGIHIEAKPSNTELFEGKSYDVALVRIRALDDYGNQVSFFNEPVSFETEGPIEIIGEPVIGFKGGMAGVYVKTTGQSGAAKLTVRNTQCEAVTISFNVNK